MNSSQLRYQANTYNNYDPEYLDRKIQDAIEHHSAGQLEKAAAIYDEILSINPENPCANFNMGTIHHNDGALRNAIGCYKKVLAEDPENFQTLFFLAGAYRDNGFPEQAAVTYQRALEVESNHPDIHYNLGILYQQLNFHEESVESYQKTLTLDPNYFPALYNLGALCFDCGIHNKALEYYNKAHEVNPEDLDCCYNIGLTHFYLGNYRQSANCYEQVLAISPKDAALYNTLGTVYRQLGNYQKAADLYKKSLTLQPDFGNACTNLAIVMQMLDNTTKALIYFQKAVELGHEVESANHMIAALSGKARTNTPRSYIEDLFDSYAVNFDKKLQNELNYDVPLKLYALHEVIDHTETYYRHVIDLGCGTGLAGEQFRDLSGNLTGVDLSTKMIEQAEKKEIYDQLHCEDIINFLSNSDIGYDLVLAADVMVYIGDLDTLFATIAEKLTNNGLFLFSVEKHDGTEYQLRPSGRYAYSNKYVKKTASDHKLHVESCWETNIRKEKNQWICGNLFALRKTSK